MPHEHRSAKKSLESVQTKGGENDNRRLWFIVSTAAFMGLLIDGMDLMFLSYSLTSLKAEFNLTDPQAGSLGSVSLLGMSVGGIIGGWAADRYGRVRTLIWTITFFSLGTAMLGLTRSYSQFAFIRGVSSLGIGAEYVVANILVAEYVPTKYRTTILGAVQAGWSVGYLVAALLARWIIPAYGWRWLFISAILPVVIVCYIRRAVPEPPAWREFAAQRALREPGDSLTAKKMKTLWMSLWSDPSARFIFIAWCATTTCLQFGYFGVSNWLPAYLEKELHVSFKSMTAYMIGTYTAMVLGKVIAGGLADLLGRRLVFASGGVATALFLPFIVHCHTVNNIAWLLLVFGFLYGIPYGVNATYMAESFTTKIRGTAVGTAYNLGRVGAAIAPLSIGFIADRHSIGLGLVVMGGAYLLCGLIPALCIPEKMHNPQTPE